MTNPLPLDFTLQTEGAGCENWKTILVGEKATLSSAEACASKCQRTAGCKNFGYQPKNCESEQKPFDQGACYLFGDDCEVSPEPCWNHYAMPDVEDADADAFSSATAQTTSPAALPGKEAVPGSREKTPTPAPVAPMPAPAAPMPAPANGTLPAADGAAPPAAAGEEAPLSAYGQHLVDLVGGKKN